MMSMRRAGATERTAAGRLVEQTSLIRCHLIGPAAGCPGAG